MPSDPASASVSPDPVAIAALTRPDLEAVADPAVRWTWAQLDRRVEAAAARLRASGAGPGDAGRVAILLGKSAGAVAAIHAVRRVGATAAMLNRRAAPVEIAAQLDAVRPAILVHDDVTAELARAAADLARTATEPAHRAAGPSRTRFDLVAITRDLGAGAAGTADGRVPERTAGPDPVAPDPIAADPLAPATLVFTSGTTGHPKAAILTAGNHVASAAAWAAFLEPAPTDRWLSCLPFHHVAGLAMIDRAARWGFPLVVQPGFDPRAVADAIEQDGISHLSLVGSTLGRLVEAMAGRPVPASLRAILVGGERTPPEVVRAAVAAGLPIVTTYGMTETGSGVVAQRPDDASLHPGAAGRPLPGVELRIRSGGRSLGPDRVGEVEVRGGMVFAGYLARPDETAAAFDGGWLRTGDLGAIDAAGRLTIADRREDLVISGGENVSPAEVEAVLRDHPDVLDAAVVGRPDPRWGAVPVAVIVARPGRDPSDADLRAHCRAVLAGYKVPVAFLRRGAIPRSPDGKLLRRELRPDAPVDGAIP